MSDNHVMIWKHLNEEDYAECSLCGKLWPCPESITKRPPITEGLRDISKKLILIHPYEGIESVAAYVLERAADEIDELRKAIDAHRTAMGPKITNPGIQSIADRANDELWKVLDD